jgi:hypothetical protein
MLDETLRSLDSIDKSVSNLIVTGKFFKAFEKCPCKSGRAFKECHFIQYQGAKILACDYKVWKEGFGKFGDIM